MLSWLGIMAIGLGVDSGLGSGGGCGGGGGGGRAAEVGGPGPAVGGGLAVDAGDADDGEAFVEHVGVVSGRVFPELEGTLGRVHARCEVLALPGGDVVAGG